MSIPDRKVIELRQKLDSLEREFQDWRARSEASQPLEKHHTQIRRIAAQLEGLQEVIRKRLATSNDNAEALLTECQSLEQMILEVHRIWEFFRSKLVLRSVEWFKTYLLVADEFAWSCYQAAQEKIRPEHISLEAVKQPPLVFFNGGSSPFTMPRNGSYQAEAAPEEGGLRTQEFIEVLKMLPIPVIGIPWFQVQHLPDMLVIGHEVGHHVEDDLDLSSRIHALVNDHMLKADIPLIRQESWHAWLGEIFADLYGTLAAGPAFVSALMDFLAVSPAEMANQRADFASDYPTHYLRILLNLEALSRLGFASESAALKAEWQATYAQHAMPEFAEDIPIIVTALLDGPYPAPGGLALPEVLSFSAADHQKALGGKDQILKKRSLSAVDQIRPLLAAARLAFAEDPDGYKKQEAHNRILDRAKAIQQIGVRAAEIRKRPDALRAMDVYDKAAGERLFQTISELKHRS